MAGVPSAEYYHAELMCDVTGISYDFVAHQGRLDMAAHNCCDMTGCIDFFLKLDARCEKIETFADGEPDTIYVLHSGVWEAGDR